MRCVFTLALAASLAVSAGAQEAAPTRVTITKDPTLAGILGVLMPGAGQVYAGETIAGIGVLVGTVAAFESSRSSCEFQPGIPLCANALRDGRTGPAIGVALWVASAIWAPFNARAWNREHGVTVSAAPTAGGASVSLSIAFR